LLEKDQIIPMANIIIIVQIRNFFLFFSLLRIGIFDSYIVSKLVMKVHAPVMIIICGATIAIIGGSAPVFPNALNIFTIK
jgi:hypothetical protein